MKLVLCSAFRDAEAQLWKYFDSATTLQKLMRPSRDELYLVIADGDSSDQTSEKLLFHAKEFDCTVVDCSHGGPKFGSIVHSERFRQLAYVGNCMLDNVPDDADYVVILDGDLIWDAEIILALVKRLKEYPAVAPMIMHRWPEHYGDNEPHFRDSWAFRRGGQRFSNWAPFHPDIREGEMLLLDSAGGCLAMRAEYARKAQFTDDKVIVGVCEDICRMGGSVWLDPGLTVWHP